ncbi:hypothetical protein BGW38_004917 [Lunasporangiospora selenospora]|uniref:RNB domain-containing protein n=1 Tax=Lunasporangiospora selenospora TaxID=979761 RepID=A0A9P6KBT9_9FUNG|nr:hypothetical protein BGW38_004917 [Lunasporangiospora selenospora]
MEHRTADVVFRIPGFLFTEKARRTVGAWDPEIQPDMPPAGSGKLAALFGEEASLLLGTHFVKFSSLYDEFWNHRQQKALTTLEAAQFVFGKEARMGQEKELTLQEIYATHMFLTQDKNLARFYPSAAVRWTGEFMIQPPHEVQLTDLVIGWIRQEDPRLEAFTQKAKELIQSYRNKEVSNWKDVQFTESDRVIIEFIRQVAVDGYYDTFPKPHLTYLPRLLRPLGLYDDMDPRTAFQFLNEIGIWPDWHNLELSRSTYQMPEMGGDDAVIVDRIRQLHPEFMDPESELDLSKEDGVSAAAVTRDTPTPMPKATSTTATSTEATINTMENTKSTTEWKPLVLQSPTELYRTDPCDSIRHDFGDIPVYAIDDPSASELDDAFSIEPVPITTLTPEASTWVHVHVADPTSILPPTHELAILASKRIQTLFLPERTWPMLPRDLTEGSLSLKNDGKPKNVLTFSARIRDLDGSIVEYRVRTGLVRNIVTLNYDEVDEVLSWGNVYGGKEEGERIRESRMSFPEQGSMVRAYYRETQGTLDRKDKKLVQELLAIQKVAVRHTSNRLGNGAFNFTMGRPLVELTPHPLPEVQDADWLAPRDFSKIPTPEISIRLDPSFASPSRMMVAEYMVMAGRVAAMFSKEHNLPVLYRQQPTPSEKYLPMFEDTIQSKSDRWTGMVNMVDMLPLRPHIPGALISLTPDPHWSLGIRDGYCKVTSPLRRYTDMIAHWQIKNKLLALSVKGSSSLVTVPPVFSVEEMVSKPGQIRDRERMLGMLEARSIKFWITEMLRRRMEAGKSMVFEGVLLNPTADGYNVISSLLGFQNVVKAEPEEIASGLGIGDRVMYELVMCNSQRPWISAKHISKL